MIRAFLELTKPRITLLVVVSGAVAYLAAAEGDPSPVELTALILGTALSAGGTNALNQWWERSLDSRMKRTEGRPLPSGRLRPAAALLFASALSVAGVLIVWTGTTALAGLLAAATVIIYVAVYTPLKQVSAVCTYVGAVPGALPVLGGWAAADTPLGAPAWGLFGVLLLWQLPHFFALEWLAREDYRRAGFRTLAVADPSGRRSARHAVAATGSLLPVSLLPLVDPTMGLVYGIGAAGGLALLLGAAVAFLSERTDVRARRLFSATLAYLPLVLAATAVDALI